MQPRTNQATFGRRRTVSQPPPRPPAPNPDPAPTPIPGIGNASPGADRQKADDGNLSPELSSSILRSENWDAPKTKRKRWLAEPYRTFTVVAGVGFGLSPAVLPDSVENIVQLVMGGLTVLGLVAGLRKSLLTSTEDAVSGKLSRD